MTRLGQPMKFASTKVASSSVRANVLMILAEMLPGTKLTGLILVPGYSSNHLSSVVPVRILPRRPALPRDPRRLTGEEIAYGSDRNVVGPADR